MGYFNGVVDWCGHDDNFGTVLRQDKDIRQLQTELGKAYALINRLKTIDVLRRSALRLSEQQDKTSTALYDKNYADLYQKYKKYMAKFGAQNLIKNCEAAFAQNKIFYPR